MADQTSEDDDLIEILSDSRENVNDNEESVSIINNGENVEDDLSEECQIVETEDDFEDLIVLDESIESRISDHSHTSGADSDSGQLEVVAEVAHEHRECCREAQKQIAELQKFIKKLEEENAELKTKLLHIPEVVVEVLDDEDKTVNVAIQDKELRNKYSSVIETYVSTLLETERKSQLKTPEASTSFFVDKYSHGDDDKEDVGEAWSIPLYDRVSGVLETAGEGSCPKDEPYFGPTCFNCDGNHMISACSQPHNPKKISENRRIFSSSQNKSAKRYHLNSKYNTLKPGEISEELRSALDLKPYQIPQYIYRMRVLGYPPGWLKEAEIQSSGLNLYDSDGKIVIDEDNVEEGEVDEVDVKVQYDPSKLINYPGFNMPIPPSFKDEHRDFKMPSLQMNQLRCEFEKSMKPPKPTPYRKHKLTSTSSTNPKRQKTADRLDEDMEIEITSDGVDVVDVGTTFSTPKSRIIQLRLDSQSEEGEDSTESSPSVTSLEERRKQLLKELDDKYDVESSPSLTILEERKLRLLKELEDKSDLSDNDCAIIEGDSEVILDLGKKTTNGVKQIDLEDKVEGETLETATINDDKLNTTPNGACREVLKKSLAITPGTPVMSLKTKLPDSDQFAKGISEHIPFENLPSSTGTYEKMRAIIDKTRRMANSL